MTSKKVRPSWHERQKAKGLCLHCVNPAEPGFLYCKKHVKKLGLTGRSKKLRDFFNTLTVSDFKCLSTYELGAMAGCSQMAASFHKRRRLKELLK